MAVKRMGRCLQCFGREIAVHKASVDGELTKVEWSRNPAVRDLHPAWRSFMAYCERMRHGEIERLKIQDGLPMVAEVTRKKVKFT